jgi:glycosyltransferase involved in cell wall biosynthesis
LERFLFCPHPIDEDRYSPYNAVERRIMRKALFNVNNRTIVLFAPARQNWALKGNDKYLRAVRDCVEAGIPVKLFIPGWGQEVERSKQYCADLGIENVVHWMKPISEGGLIKYFSSADIVLDQFVLGVFGLITPKALSCGAVVITSYDSALNAWCFSKHPPLLPAKEADEIYAHICTLHNDREKLLQIAKDSRSWVLSEHSKTRVKDILLRAGEEALRHFSLNQKKLV